MAQTTRILLTDDLDGSEATETIVFSVDGVNYEIDLNEEHAKQLREALSPYADAARRVSGGRRGPAKRAAAKPAGDKPDTGAVRQWATDQGIEVSERGRLSNDLIMKFQEANA